MASVAFYKCLRSQYEAQSSINPDALYFLIDSKQIYRGEVELTKCLYFVNTWVEVLEPIPGKFYLNMTSGELRTYLDDGTAKVIVPPVASSASDFDSVTKRDYLASLGAIKDFVEEQIADLHAVEDINFNRTAGDLEVELDNRVKKVKLRGVAHDVQWSSTSDIIRIPMYGGEDLVINLPKSNLVKGARFEADYPLPDPPGGHGPAIVFTIWDGTTLSELVLPASTLVPKYMGGTTDTITVIVDDGNGVIKADAKISDSLNNLLTARADGLFVDGSDLAVKNRNLALNEIILSDGNGGFIRSETYISNSELKANFVATGDIVAQAINAAVTAAKTELNARIAAVDAKVDQVASDLADLSQDVTSDIADIEQDITDIGTRIDGVDSTISALDTKVDGVDNKVDAAVTRIDGIDVKLGTPVQDEVIIGGTSNSFVSSGKTIGGATLDSTPSANVLATEAAVAKAADDAKTRWNNIAP